MNSLLFFGFLKKNGIKLLLIIMLSVVMATCACSRYGRPIFFPVNIELPVDLSKTGSVVETEFSIFFEDQYELHLQFFYSKKDIFTDTNLLKFLGFREDAPGQTIPIELLIVKIDDKKESLVFEKIYETKGINGIGERVIIRDLGALSIKAGKYRVKLKNKKGFQELSNTQVSLSISYYRR